MAIGLSDAETFWTTFPRSLARRGWCGVKVVIAYDHKGLKRRHHPDPRSNHPALSRPPHAQPCWPIGTVAACFLDEVFPSWLWLCRIGSYIANSPRVLFTPRPPELIELAAVPSYGEDTVPAIVYPEPLLAADEERLFKDVAPGVRVQTLTDWLEERR